MRLLTTIFQALLATLALACAVVTTAAMIARGDRLAGIVGFGAVTALIAGLAWLSYMELRDEIKEGGQR